MLRQLTVLLIFFVCFSACREADTGPKPPPEDVYLDPAEVSERERHVWQKPGIVIDALGDIEEKVIADIGAGEGFFARRLAPLADRVIAVEIDQRFIDYLDTLKLNELPKKYRPRLEPRLAQVDDPGLASGEVDIVMFVNTLYQIDQPVAYLKKLMPALRRNGRVVIVDWKKRRTTPIAPPQEERMALFEAESMLQEAGFEIIEADDLSLEYQYIIVAEKPVSD